MGPIGFVDIDVLLIQDALRKTQIKHIDITEMGLSCFHDNALLLLSGDRWMLKLDIKRRDCPKRDFSRSILDSDNLLGIEATDGVIQSIAYASFPQSELHLKISSNRNIINPTF